MEKPKIRFGKFNNKWKKNKLDKVVDFFDNQRIPIDSGERKAGPYPYYGASGIIDYVDGYIFNGEYVLLAEDGANIIFRSSPIAYLTKGKFWLNNHAHIMKMKTGSNEFLIQLLEKQNYEKYNTGTAQPKLNGEVVKKISLHFPSDDEQSAIGSLFRTIDDLLASYKDNLTNYQSLKATMHSKMFPKAGQTVPEIRLDGFEGEWEIKKFKSISNKRGKSNSKGYDYPAYSVSNQSGLIPQSEQFEGSRLENLEKTSYKIVEPNEFAYNPARINVGSIAFNDLHETVIVSSLYVIFSLDKSMDNNYALLFIKSAEFNKEVRRNTEGSVREYLFYENFANIRIPIPPSLEEQHAIGIYFSNLDNLINSHQEKISQLETLKKKLLQDMFI